MKVVIVKIVFSVLMAILWSYPFGITEPLMFFGYVFVAYTLLSIIIYGDVIEREKRKATHNMKIHREINNLEATIFFFENNGFNCQFFKDEINKLKGQLK